MLNVETIPEAPPADLRFRRKVGLVERFVFLWHRREVIRSLADRDFRARYKQAVLGVSWAVIQPISMVVIFTVVVQHALKVGTGGVPYPIWTFLGLIAWSFFSEAMTIGTISLVSNQPLINKVNCPRECFPIASVALSTLDTGISMIALPFFFIIFHFVPTWTLYWVPLIFFIQICFTLGAVLIVSVLVVYLRDLRQVIPIIVQLGLFASPIAYNVTNYIPRALRIPYDFLNPMAPVIDSYRDAVLYGHAPAWGPLGAAAASSLIVLVVGFRVFKRLETGIADLI